MIAPLAIAALNTQPEQALARLLAAVLRETLMRGGDACLPMFPRDGLSAALIDPAVALLAGRGATFHFGRRIAALEIAGGRVTGLAGPDGPISLGPADAVVLAVPPWVASDLLPGLMVPAVFEAILNMHFRDRGRPGPGRLHRPDRRHRGVGVRQARPRLRHHQRRQPPGGMDADRIVASVWPNVRAALRLSGRLPPWRVVKERRATFAATAAQERRRPAARTDLANLVLAGDWTATGLPATIEGAIRSGEPPRRCWLARGPA